MEIVSDSEGKEDITEESTETDRVAKGYDLPVSDSERKEAEDDCKEKMELIAELYKNADKGYASNVIIADEIIDQMYSSLSWKTFITKAVTIPLSFFILLRGIELLSSNPAKSNHILNSSSVTSFPLTIAVSGLYSSKTPVIYSPSWHERQT